MGQFGQIFVPHQTTKLVQISTRLLERASKKMPLLKEPAFYVNVNKF